jgi:hypothetical protein
MSAEEQRKLAGVMFTDMLGSSCHDFRQMRGVDPRDRFG